MKQIKELMKEAEMDIYNFHYASHLAKIKPKRDKLKQITLEEYK